MKAQVVTFHYTLKDTAGKTIDSSAGGDPMVYMEGAGQIIPGLESKMKSLKAGDKKTIKVDCDDAYGQRDDTKTVTIPKDQLPPGEKIKVGNQYSSHDQNGEPQFFVVTEVTGDEVTMDGNHPLAGQDLTFEVEVVVRRDATEEELSHGHAHGGDGHHHH